MLSLNEFSKDLFLSYINIKQASINFNYNPFDISIVAKKTVHKKSSSQGVMDAGVEYKVKYSRFPELFPKPVPPCCSKLAFWSTCRGA